MREQVSAENAKEKNDRTEFCLILFGREPFRRGRFSADPLGTQVTPGGYSGTAVEYGSEAWHGVLLIPSGSSCSRRTVRRQRGRKRENPTKQGMAGSARMTRKKKLNARTASNEGHETRSPSPSMPNPIPHASSSATLVRASYGVLAMASSYDDGIRSLDSLLQQCTRYSG